MPDLSDNEIIAREKRKFRQAAISGFVGGLIFVGLTILLWNVRPNWVDKFLFLVPLIVIAAVFAAWYLFWRPAPEALANRITKKRIDEFQGRNRMFLLVGVLLIGNFLLHAPAIAQQTTPGGLL